MAGAAAHGHRAIGAIGTFALVALLALGVCAAKAGADPLSMKFTESRANVGVQLADAALFEAPDTAPFEAQIDPGSGAIAAGTLTVPQFSTHITDPLDADVTVDFEIGIITGSFTQSSGALTLEGPAGGTLTAEGKECTVSTTPAVLTLTTAGNSGGTSPRTGTPFTEGLAGSGAIAGQWTDMSAEPAVPGVGIAVCETVDERIGGPGGVWLEQEDGAAPAAPQLTSTNPASPGSSGVPRILGSAEPGSTVRLYAGPNCTGAPVATVNAAKLSSPGVPVAVAEGVTAAFSATATDAAGNTSACSTPLPYTHLKVSPPACVVPKLVGKTLARAKTALAAAGCKLGTVHRPKPQKRKGRTLVVKSSSPQQGASPADRKVDLRLGPKPRKARA